jgi:hypothetical protein
MIGAGLTCEWESYPTACNNIFWNNDSPAMFEIALIKSGQDFPALHISYCDIERGKDSVYIEPGAALNWGSGMIDSDPLFVDAANGDYHLTFNSPCRGSGDNSAVTELYDYEGDPRIYQGCRPEIIRLPYEARIYGILESDHPDACPCRMNTIQTIIWDLCCTFRFSELLNWYVRIFLFGLLSPKAADSRLIICKHRIDPKKEPRLCFYLASMIL